MQILLSYSMQILLSYYMQILLSTKERAEFSLARMSVRSPNSFVLNNLQVKRTCVKIPIFNTIIIIIIILNNEQMDNKI